jgi:hypothetical protein
MLDEGMLDEWGDDLVDGMPGRRKGTGVVRFMVVIGNL